MNKRVARPISATPPPPEPLIAPTGSPGLNSVIDVVNAAAAPFQQAPPPEQGVAGWVSQELGGVLGLMGAPAELIDTAFASLTAPLAALFPALPACTIGALHIGLPHIHMHPPSFIPPAPPIPLPSIGMVLGSCAITVHIGGLPAARAGDIGIAITCCSLAPPFEIFTGSSNVFVGGSRAARMLDLTQHCNPSSMGAFGVIMGAAGVVAGAAGAIATGNSYAGAQAAADAAVLVLKLLCGKDPGLPPGVGVLLGPPVPNVLIGGFPCPPIGEMAVGGLMKKLKKGFMGLVAKYNARRCNGVCANGSHPIYLPTGENFDHFVDFVSGGLFEWRRYVSSARVKEDGPHGYGWRHFLQRTLSVRLNRAVYTDWDGEQFEFPRFRRGSDTVRSNGYVLRRLERGKYRLSYRDEPVMEFAGEGFDGELPLVGLYRDGRELRLERDALGRLCAAEEWVPATPQERRRWVLRLDGGGRVMEIAEIGVGGAGAATVGKPIVRAMFEYDAAGNLVKAVDALGGVATYEYDSFHRVTKQTDARGYYYSFKYDVWGRCVRAAGMDGLWACRVEYFPEQGFTRYTEGEDATWEYHYEEDGFVTKIVDPYGGIKRRERDVEGRVREVDSGGRELRWLYDADGAHCARMDRFGYVYPPEAEMVRRSNPFLRKLPENACERSFGRWTRDIWTHLRRSTYILESASAQLSEQIRAIFRPTERPPLRPSARQIERDALGRRIRESDAPGRVWEWRRDVAGNAILTREPDGTIHEQNIVSWNLIGKRRDALGHTRHYTYNSLQQISSIRDPLGNVSSYEYDRKRRLVRVIRNDRIREEYVYDEADRLVEKLNGAGDLLFRNEYYDNALVRARHLATGGVHRLAYDKRGRVTEASTAEHVISLAWDAYGDPLLDLRDGRGIEHQRQRAGVWISRILDRFEITTDASKRGSYLLIDTAGLSTHLSCDGNGTVRRSCPSGTLEIMQYDDGGRLLGRLVYRYERDEIAFAWCVRYDYSQGGDLVREQDNLRGTTIFETDATHRLVAELTPEGNRLEFAYDSADNLLSKPGLTRLEVGPGNRVIRSADEVFEHDDRDRIRLRRASDGTVTRYTYDAYDMLVRVEITKGDTNTRVWTATYDAIGRRIRTEVDSQCREFYWDGDRLAAETLIDGTFRVYEYITREALVPIGFVDYSDARADPISGRSYSVFCNPVGLPIYIEDFQGTIVWWTHRLDPYGSLDIDNRACLEYNLRWPGHYYDAETELHYNRHRYYDPRIGRYLQSDPTGHEGSPVNLYAYCTNPLVNVDILGLSQEHGPPSSSEQHRPNGSETTGEGDTSSPRRLSNDEGQRIVDELHSLSGNEKSRRQSTTTLTECGDGSFIVTTSGRTTSSQREAARTLLGADVGIPDEPGNPMYSRTGRDYPEVASGGHGEPRGMRAAENAGTQAQRQWSSSDASHGGAACDSCAQLQQDNGVINETGTQRGGGRSAAHGSGGQS